MRRPLINALKDKLALRNGTISFLGWLLGLMGAWLISVMATWKMVSGMAGDMPEVLRQNVFAAMQSCISLAFGTGLIWKIVDRLTPSLSFRKLSEEKPHLMVILIAVILMVLAYLMKMLDITSVPLPE